MNKINHDVKNSFELFSKLRDENKIIISSDITFEVKENNAKWEKWKSDIDHQICEYDIEFIVEVQKGTSKYGVKLHCKNFTKQPYFRFDSEGPSHRNYSIEIPLEEQSVSTPHFNSFDLNGYSIAYKNDVLKSETESKAIQEDLNFGVALFCDETNTKLENKKYPQFKRQDLLLDLSDVKSVPNFFTDNITFE